MDEGPTTILPRPDRPWPNRVLDERHELLDELGSGDLSRVFRAWDHRLQQMVAVRRLKDHWAANEQIVRAFEQGAVIAAGLPSHASLVPIYDAGRDGDLPYVVMQFAAGGSIKERIAREAPLPVDRSLAIACQIADALDVVHQYGVVHGNVKPQNILLTKDGQAKLGDAGMSQAEALAERDRHAAVRSQYVAPESLLGGAPGPYADIYALGVTLYEMLTGSLPFATGNPDPRRLNPSVPDATAEVVMRALQPEPADRYRSAAALAAALRSSMADLQGITLQAAFPTDPAATAEVTRVQPIAPSRLQAATPVRPPVRKRSLSFTGLLYALTLAIAGVGGWYAYQPLHRAFYGSPGTSRHHARGAHHTAVPHAAGIQSHPARHGPAPACGIGPVRLVRVWAENIRPPAGAPTAFDYTVANDSAGCRRIFLGLTAFSDSRPGTALSDPAADRIVPARPGVHTYTRLFVFPPSAAGRRFDVLWSVTGPARKHTYGLMRVNRLVAVLP